ncbi:hypothetical protein Bca52824_004971 [Brassica carinata]|uniref:Uncharacterized protein n=1 Tax=Brassica carinata TaxID=52824 RepID=A0A8X7WQ00_BRACI|nr:hypothetical protein Bca52824_004971 [Brassica carinata]
MAQKMCMVMMMVMVLVTVECATINQALQDYNSCVTDCVDKCGGDKGCIYRCKWKCLKPHSPQVNLEYVLRIPSL